MKRLTDIVLALVALAVLGPPFLVIMVILRLTGEGKVWFPQERVGQGGRLFKVFKFVTMYEGSEHRGDKDITVPGDARVLPVGRFLRKYKINELPQFINVLIGDMSMVGWRPLLPQGFELYPPDVQETLLRIKPGLTGLGSLTFNSEEEIIGEARQTGQDLRACYRDEIMPYKGMLECWYVKHHSFGIDLKVLFLTPYALVFPVKDRLRKLFPDLPEPASDLVRKHCGFAPLNADR